MLLEEKESMTATALPRQATSTPFWKRRTFQRAMTGWLFAAPILIYFAIFVFGPILASLVMMFTEWNGFGPLSQIEFVGLTNVRGLFQDEKFLGAFRNTFIYAVVVVTSGIVFGLALAMVLNGVTRFVGFVRSIYYLPVMLPMTAMALLWGLIYQQRYGFLNQLLLSFGLDRVPWLINPQLALYSIAFMVIWKGVGWYMVIFLAGLKAIPEEFYEAARVDGANGWHQFWGITLPLLKPTLLFVLVVAVIGSLQVFSPVFIMTRGGPANATNVVVYWVYVTAFEFMRFGYATAQAVFLFSVILVITLIQLRLFREGGLTSYY
jgi:ABC-type sugar transport system permease subunit